MAKRRVRLLGTVTTAALMTTGAWGQTYAERLGWGAEERVVILHVDDAGMSHDSNVGAANAILEGLANSLSVMMPCPWVPELVDWLGEHPEVDAGLHLTLTSEWDIYRWGPLVGRPRAPGLVDSQGAMWRSVEEVVAHATADEVEAEIREQVHRARTMGFEPTHLDSHMGTLFATPDFLERYVRVGLDLQIPIMLPGGHNTLLRRQYEDDVRRALERQGRKVEGPVALPAEVEARLQSAAEIGHRVWDGGLPVLDDLHNTSYGWRPSAGEPADEGALRDLKTRRYSEAFAQLRPGVTMVIMHATQPSENFPSISDSGPSRWGDMLAMMDPRLAAALEREGLVLTTWRELHQRRQSLMER